MDDAFPALFIALAGFVGGIALFVRGLVAYRHDRRISSVATSSLDALAAGEVRVSGVVEAIGPTLVSPLQSRPCVWYRARIEEQGDRGRVLLDEERSQAFRVDDGRGTIRIIPRGARWEIGASFDESSSLTGADPVGLHRRTGSSIGSIVGRDAGEMTEAERQMAIAALLTVQRPGAPGTEDSPSSGSDAVGGALRLGMATRTRYREARLEPGETVTIVGQALPWADVRELLLTPEAGSNMEAAIAADIALARRAGVLAASPQEAWGNAAIPGFGIGQPTLPPSLHPDARPPQMAGREAHEEAIARHDIPPDELVLSRGEAGAMAVYKGPPEAATSHHDLAFLLGVAGAILAVVCALALGAILAGTL